MELPTSKTSQMGGVVRQDLYAKTAGEGVRAWPRVWSAMPRGCDEACRPLGPTLWLCGLPHGWEQDRNPRPLTRPGRRCHRRPGCEVIVIDRDTTQAEIFRLAGPQYVALQADREGWLDAETMQIRFRGTRTTPARLAVADGTNAMVCTET